MSSSTRSPMATCSNDCYKSRRKRLIWQTRNLFYIPQKITTADDMIRNTRVGEIVIFNTELVVPNKNDLHMPTRHSGRPSPRDPRLTATARMKLESAFWDSSMRNPGEEASGRGLDVVDVVLLLLPISVVLLYNSAAASHYLLAMLLMTRTGNSKR